MSLKSFDELQKTIISILNQYCNNYFIIKPTYYPLAKKYLNKLHKLKEGNGDSNLMILKMAFNIYKILVKNKSEALATSIGLTLAKHLNVKESDFLTYRDSKIWTQRYIQGIGLFGSRVYRKTQDQIISGIEIDPVYSAYTRLNNQLELSTVVAENHVN